MTESATEKAKLAFPPMLIVVDALAMIGVGLSLAEMLPNHGRSLGLISPDLVSPVFWVSVGIAAFCMYKMTGIILQRGREKSSGQNGTGK